MSQPPYGQPSPYGQQPPPPYGMAAPDHPQAMTVLILGILGLALCQLLGPFAWVMGNRVVREIDTSGGRYGGRTNANVGRILGIVGTAVFGLYLLATVGFVAIAIGTAATSGS